MKDHKELPPQDQPDPDYDALLKKLGLIHIGEAIQASGDIVLLAEQSTIELKKALLAQAGLVGKSRDEIEAILTRICREHAERFEERARAVMRDYSDEKKSGE